MTAINSATFPVDAGVSLNNFTPPKFVPPGHNPSDLKVGNQFATFKPDTETDTPALGSVSGCPVRSSLLEARIRWDEKLPLPFGRKDFSESFERGLEDIVDKIKAVGMKNIRSIQVMMITPTNSISGRQVHALDDYLIGKGIDKNRLVHAATFTGSAEAGVIIKAICK